MKTVDFLHSHRHTHKHIQSASPYQLLVLDPFSIVRTILPRLTQPTIRGTKWNPPRTEATNGYISRPTKSSYKNQHKILWLNKTVAHFFNDHFNIFCWECVTISPIPSVRLREIHVWCCKSVCLCSYMQTQCKYTYLRCILWVVSSRIRDSEFMAEIIFLGDPLDEETSNTMDDPSWMTWKMPGKYQDTWRGLSNYPEAGGYNCEYKGACTVIRGLLAVACVQQIPVWNFVNVYAQLLFHWNSTLQKQTPETLPPCL